MMSIEKIEMMRKHSQVIGQLMGLFNLKYMPILPGVEQKSHPQHESYCHAVTVITDISERVLRLLEDGDL